MVLMNLTHDIIYDKTLFHLSELYKNRLYKDIYLNLLNKYETCLIGGAIRDFCFDSQPKDLDFVINIPDKELLRCISKYNYKVNKFGGYKIVIDQFYLDIWSIDNHWAFKNQILSKKIENLEYTTFYNFDSLVFNLSENKLYAECFLDAYNSRTLDITLDKKYLHKNPGKISNVYKACKLADDWNLNFSPTTLEYLVSWKNSFLFPLNQLRRYEESNNNNKLLSSEFISYLEKF